MGLEKLIQLLRNIKFNLLHDVYDPANDSSPAIEATINHLIVLLLMRTNLNHPALNAFRKISEPLLNVNVSGAAKTVWQMLATEYQYLCEEFDTDTVSARRDKIMKLMISAIQTQQQSVSNVTYIQSLLNDFDSCVPQTSEDYSALQKAILAKLDALKRFLSRLFTHVDNQIIQTELILLFERDPEAASQRIDMLDEVRELQETESLEDDEEVFSASIYNSDEAEVLSPGSEFSDTEQDAINAELERLLESELDGEITGESDALARWQKDHDPEQQSLPAEFQTTASVATEPNAPLPSTQSTTLPDEFITALNAVKNHLQQDGTFSCLIWSRRVDKKAPKLELIENIIAELDKLNNIKSDVDYFTRRVNINNPMTNKNECVSLIRAIRTHRNSNSYGNTASFDVFLDSLSTKTTNQIELIRQEYSITENQNQQDTEALVWFPRALTAASYKH